MASLTAILSIGSAIAGVAGTALSVFGAIQQGKAADAAAQYQANVATVNAGIAEKNANRSIDSASEEQRQQDMSANALFGTQEARQGASGLSVNSGSALATRRSARQLSRLDALNIRQQGDVQAYGYRTDAANQHSQAEFSKMQGKNALTSSYLDAATSLVGGASSLIGGLGKFDLLKPKSGGSVSRRDPWQGMRTA